MQAAGRVTGREAFMFGRMFWEDAAPRATPLTPAFLAIVQNRELQIMKMLDHGNVTTLHHYFYTEGEKVKRCSRTLPELRSAFSACFASRAPRPARPSPCARPFAPAPFAHRSPTRPT